MCLSLKIFSVVVDRWQQVGFDFWGWGLGLLHWTRRIQVT